MRSLVALILALALPFAAAAQDRGNTILVLDGSGSMWGQIDGINKIVIAREVVGDLLDTFPQDQNLGLTVYGHRTRGDCTDIETVVPPGPDTLGSIREAVNAINPRGRTPMTDAIVAAAEALRYTENRATVILVSDGIETCNPDPCAAARALEQGGVDFTAHVIGFDVTDPEALAQMQCIADETGGTFRSASNAAELTDALTVAVAEPEPVPQTVRLVAVHAPGGPELEAEIDWKVGTGDATEDGTGPGFSLGLMAGGYDVRGIRTEDGVEAAAAFTVPEATEDDGLRVEVVFPEPAPVTAEVTFVATLETGGNVQGPVFWTVTPSTDMTPQGAEGNPLTVEMEVGAYTAEAYWTVTEETRSTQFAFATDDNRTVLVSFPPPPVSAALEVPETAPLGATIEIGWDGPDEQNDYIEVARADEDNWINYAYTRDGNPVLLQMPPEVGAFEVRYVRNAGREVLATEVIEVTPVEVSLAAPDNAEIGAEVEVAWIGPDYQNDYIEVGRSDEDGWIEYTYTRAGQPLDLTMPGEPGDYLLRYVLSQGRTVLAERPITVTAVGASVIAPEQAPAGSTVEVAWTGPDRQNDYVAVGAPGEDGYINYTYTRNGSPLDLLLPPEPGEYELRYVLNQTREVLATRPISITEITATLEAPEEADAGATIEVAWQGPDYRNDYISVGDPEEESYINYTYTRDGSPLELVLPPEPGTYELRYVVNQDRSVLATRAITVTDIGAMLEAAAEVTAGDTLDVTWEGPDYQNDYIAISRPDDDGYESYRYTRDGSPAEVRVPSEPGDYEVRYVVNQDRSVIATRPLTVTPVTATLTAPASAVAGETVEIGWDGPDYQNDYVSVGEADDDGYIAYGYTRNGNPAEVTMPAFPGTYELRYVMNLDRTVLATSAIEVGDVTASLADGSGLGGRAGGTIEVPWTGPDYGNDIVMVTAPGEDRYLSYAYTRNGSPAELDLPEQPGSYEIKYRMNNENRVLATIPLEVTAE